MRHSTNVPLEKSVLKPLPDIVALLYFPQKLPLQRMKFAIIAAGEGSRLATEGITVPKPLIPLQHTPMIERLIGIFHRCGAEEIVVAVNTLRPETHQHLLQFSQTHRDVPLRIVVADTPSSMHTFAALAPYLQDAPFCLTTVDTIFHETAFRDYLHHTQSLIASGYDGCMAVTDFIDDERPLYVATNENMDITAFLDENTDNYRFISGGIYTLSPRALHTLSRCMSEGQHRLRNFQRGLLVDGLRLQAFCFDKILDIDHASDIAKAETFLQQAH